LDHLQRANHTQGDCDCVARYSVTVWQRTWKNIKRLQKLRDRNSKTSRNVRNR